MTPQELKNSILQLAIQGKLVEQRPEEGTGDELYKRIQAEKQKLIKDGKLKKEKPLLKTGNGYIYLIWVKLLEEEPLKREILLCGMMTGFHGLRPLI